MAKTCLLTGAPLTEDNDSLAHIIPSALGGRLKPKGLLSRQANGLLNDAVDLPLIRAFGPIMSLLGGSRDRGSNPSVRMTDHTGRSYDVRFDEPVRLARPEFAMTDQSDGSTAVKVSARTQAELLTLLGQVKKRFPALDLQALVDRAEVERRPAGTLRAELQFGPASTFPGAFVAASLFAAYRGFDAHPGLSTYVGALDPSAEPILLPPDTFLWHRPTWFTVDADVSHVLALIGDPDTARMLAFVEYLNIASIAVILPFSGSAPVRETYAIDILAGREARIEIDEAALMSYPWAASHTLDQRLFEDVTERASRVIGIAQGRAQSAAIATAIEEALGPADGRPLTGDDLSRVVDRLTELFSAVLRPAQADDDGGRF